MAAIGSFEVSANTTIELDCLTTYTTAPYQDVPTIFSGLWYQLAEPFEILVEEFKERIRAYKAALFNKSKVKLPIQHRQRSYSKYDKRLTVRRNWRGKQNTR